MSPVATGTGEHGMAAEGARDGTGDSGEARARRGMTRKILARDSKVSERYLAQLEAGQGNISIALLRQIAHAMGLPLGDLVREEPDRPVELTLLIQTLSRLPAKDPAGARKLLAETFG